MTDRAIITYIRVSTSQQGRSGLGIEAQRQALHHFAQAGGFEVVREFVEVETGKGADALDRRPQLKAALAAARKLRCHVAVAKLDRLSRDVHFVSGLMAHKVPFLVAELGLTSLSANSHSRAAAIIEAMPGTCTTTRCSENRFSNACLAPNWPSLPVIAISIAPPSRS